jgi:hypothetical protein
MVQLLVEDLPEGTSGIGALAAAGNEQERGQQPHHDKRNAGTWRGVGVPEHDVLLRS